MSRPDDRDPVRTLTPADCDAALLALNNRHAVELSPLTLPRLRELAGVAFLAARVGAADALLLAFDQDAPYDSANFLWFRERYGRFVYVDRVVVASAKRGAGLARSLYGRLEDTAVAAGHTVLACEINAVPPNPASDRFHARMGFATVGGGDPSPGKRVRYCLKALEAS
ncbi:MAG: GNAT family N-acetyltransferase [Gluconacetobacter diazotrophicus]|nr:GNAT family N-acetyltransferase [Gluconacetobacter diazotrophicus]